ncbi:MULTISPECIES: hypothetical protein [unclassified Bradyrhizobium]|jgi:hypothetical protein|uniref:hypothetical protein n=1 Tax=unclassified Bradyrhizobium TaxID=2631580 RepID=UPI001FF8CBAF|nr:MULTISPECIES: hypothetical protein [unclassified Bradyrhizobium]MCK1268450.1 hypothetical protein [Bradyrhizobium sp. 84]MCK1373873.1 hypothetical protein [Bradyrhizobium sp. 49]MCK1522891.1 hypothetical protein [Bradyrhizobium sp. 17]MCK1612065.1 hypothetical protein [Bradyrhizobium sp. 163]MCK1686631.1 hypothetical protein [Bradyrhizobium sp. 145]
MANEVDTSSELFKIAKLNGDFRRNYGHAHRSDFVSPHRGRRPPKPLALGQPYFDRLFSGADLLGAAWLILPALQ